MADPYPELYSYIPLSDVEFCTALVDAEKALGDTTTLFDIGCGIGAKLELAAELGWQASGIEIRPRYAETCYRKGLNCIFGDARTFTDYDQYDCVFLNYPIIDAGDEATFEAYVMEHMKVGAVLMIFGVTDIASTTGWESVGDHCWRKLPA